MTLNYYCRQEKFTKLALPAMVLVLASILPVSAQFTGQPYPNNPSVIGLYHLNESSGTIAFDDNNPNVRANGYGTSDGILNAAPGSGGPQWVSALYGNGLQFMGGSFQNVNVGGGDSWARWEPQLRIDLDLMLSADPIVNGRMIFANAEGITAQIWTPLTEGGPARLYFLVRDNTGAWNWSDPAYLQADGSTWYNLSFQIDNSVSGFTAWSIWDDGVQITSNSVNANRFNLNSSLDIYFGGGAGYSSQAMTLDEIRIMNALTPVPEPSAFAIAALGGVLTTMLRRRG